MLNLPADIDTEILNLVDANPKLTVPMIVRDIARIIHIVSLVEKGVLDEKTVVCGGMALRCFKSTRFTIYDTDTSTAIKFDRLALARALDCEDDDIRIRAASPQEWDYGYKLVTAQPITYEPFFTTLDPGDTTYSLTVSQRGLERDGLWMDLETGYPFIEVPTGTQIPVMNIYEILAEKLVSWWLFGHAKHYADIAFIGRLLKPKDVYKSPEAKAEAAELVEKKLEVNREQHEKRVQALTPTVRRERLEQPENHINPKNNWDKVSYLGAQQLLLAQAHAAAVEFIVPLLFEIEPTSEHL